MAGIVLIHGAFHGGWCWRKVAKRLRAEGHEVFCPTLTGLGERAHLIGPQVDLETHIADIVNVIEAEEVDHAVLVSHSYGGMPMTGVADRLAERLSALVFLDSYAPQDGDSAISVRSKGAEHLPLHEPEDGYSMPVPSAEAFGLDGELAAWVDRRLTPHPFPSFTQPIHLTGAWRQVPRKVYIRMASFPASHFDRYYEAAEADPDWIAIRREGPHDIMIAEPGWLVGVLKDHVLEA